MTTNASLLPKEIAALVHHVELNRSGWWDKAVQRLVLASVWLFDHPPSTDEIRNALVREFKLGLSQEKLVTALRSLEKQDFLVQLQDNSYRIPDTQREVFEREIDEAEKIANAARDYFCTLSEKLCQGLDPKIVWSAFESDFLVPLIQEVGANAYRLLTGERLDADKQLLDRFLTRFEVNAHHSLKDVITAFLDPKKDEVRTHISRMLHARFCVEAGGLPESVIQKLNATVGKQVRFRLFVDTNFLFSLLELHENPSNAVAGELQDLVTQLKSNPKVELFILPNTIEEAKSSIASAKSRFSGIPDGRNFTQAALQVGLSGMAERFLTERLRRGGKLSAEDWFEPYLSDFVAVARGKGIELFNQDIGPYSMRQDVIDDILSVQDFEMRLDENKRKSYQKVAHDMILWHVVKDRRAAYIESPIEAQEWLLTVDFRLIGFDEHKMRQSGSTVPLCLHPTSLIQLLQFWVPRTKEFEESMLGSMRLPFLFQEFDVDAERTSLRILKGLGRFEGRDDISEQIITNVILNEGLRSRLQSNQTVDGDAEIALIRDALVAEMKTRADAAGTKAQQLQNTVKEREVALIALNAENRAKDEEVQRLRTIIAEEEFRSKAMEEKLSEQGGKVAAQAEEIAQLKDKWERTEEKKKQHRVLFGYFGLLAALFVVSGVAAWQTDRLFAVGEKIVGGVPIKVLAAVLMFVFGHLLLEQWGRSRPMLTQLWPFKQVRRFRRWLWTLVVLGFLLGVLGNLYANWIQKNLEQEERGSSLTLDSAPATSGPRK